MLAIRGFGRHQVTQAGTLFYEELRLSAHALRGMRPYEDDMELLAPAGGQEQLEYAIRFGADAVYLACDRFGMRQRASNFALEDIRGAVEAAHAQGVKVYVTLNIMMHEGDLELLPSYIEALRDSDVDAFIIGDLGAARLAREIAPEVALHVSTQASVSNAYAARAWHELGAKRIVCAREMSLADISSMRESIPGDLELEVFVHGAMCMAYSGRCLISDFLTGRSAQSGHCAQSCRWSYALEEEKRPGEFYPIEEDGRGTYIMNAQDLNMLAHLDDLAQAGIDCVKIEGRNKKAFYVAMVVNAYRNVLDGKPAQRFIDELELVSHRPYSTGFFYGPAHQSPKTTIRTQKREWAAEVVSCKEIEGTDEFEVEVRCRNAFSANTPLEALSPRQEVRDVSFRDLRHAEFGLDERVEMANRAMERYAFRCSERLEPHDILRMPKRVTLEAG